MISAAIKQKTVCICGNPLANGMMLRVTLLFILKQQCVKSLFLAPKKCAYKNDFPTLSTACCCVSLVITLVKAKSRIVFGNANGMQ